MRMRLKIAAILSACLLALQGAAGAAAQDQHEHYGAQPGIFDLYLLSLSWSPGFCDIEGDRKGKPECRGGAQLGFVVHGLWPQFENGDYPSFCDRSKNFVPGASLQIAREIYRDKGLAIGEWRKHGECTGLEPSLYYQAEIALFRKIKVPGTLAAPAAPLRASPAEIARAFASANPGLIEPGMVSVSCRRRELEEVRFCVTKDLSGFRACGNAVPDVCNDGEITIPAVR
ncbi:ribonuclease T2 [Rhizobiales bacterium GAS191]|nr:ribonuclease T2 [Rhizobiales bacterium GAS191]